MYPGYGATRGDNTHPRRLAPRVVCVPTQISDIRDAGASTALLTDQYELTMLSAALADGSAFRNCLPFCIYIRFCCQRALRCISRLLHR